MPLKFNPFTGNFDYVNDLSGYATYAVLAGTQYPTEGAALIGLTDPYGIITATTVEEAIWEIFWRTFDITTGTEGTQNIVYNSNFNSFGSGTFPGWTLTGAGATVENETTIIYGGTSSAKITRAGTDCYLSQDLTADRGLNYWKGKYVVVSGWVYCDTASTASIALQDYTGSIASNTHSGNSAWQYLVFGKYVETYADQLSLRLRVSSNDTSAYFWGVQVTEGQVAWAWNPKSVPYIGAQGNVDLGNYDIAALTHTGSFGSIGNDTTSNVTVYPIWSTETSGHSYLRVSSSKCYFNPSTGYLITSNLSGSNTGDQDLSGYVPYTGANQNVDLGNYNIYADVASIGTTHLPPFAKVYSYSRIDKDDYTNFLGDYYTDNSEPVWSSRLTLRSAKGVDFEDFVPFTDDSEIGRVNFYSAYEANNWLEFAYIKAIATATEEKVGKLEFGLANTSTPTTFLTITPEGIEVTGRVLSSYLTADTLIYSDSSNIITSLSTLIYPSLTELSYVKGVTSAIQTQLGGKASLALDNLASVAINTSLISDTDSTDDLGSTSKYWANTYSDKLYLNPTAYIDGTAVAAKFNIQADVGINAPVASMTHWLEVWSESGGKGGLAIRTLANAAAGSNLRLMKGRGTIADPRRARSGDVLCGVNAFGYYADDDATTAEVTATLANGQFQFFTAEAFTSTAKGTNFKIQLAPVGSVTVAEAFRITSEKLVGISCSAPDKALEINHVTGGCLRLTYNDSDGSATTKTDFDVDSTGEVTITSPANKTVVLSPVVYDDVRVTPAGFDRAGIADPALVSYTPTGSSIATYLYQFQVNDIAYFTVQIPHSYKQGEDIKVHVHWTPGLRGNEEDGKYVGWKVDYTWANINGTFGAMTTADLSDACDGTDDKHQMTPEVTITGTSKTISSMLICNIKRTDTGADDDWAGTASGQLPMILEIDFHFPIDTIGSRDWGTK